MKSYMRKKKKSFINKLYNRMVTQEDIDQIIRNNEKIFRSVPVQWDLSTFERKLKQSLENDKIDEPPIWSLFIPSYQRDYIWDINDQSLFIESLLLNIPIPYVFLNEDENTWRTEIVDWYQRIRTLYEFINNTFQLTGLEKLNELNGTKFQDFSPIRQQLFLNKTLNIILFHDLDDEQKKEMFSRINATWEHLNSWEKRKWIIWWPFYEFMLKLTEEELVKEMLTVSTKKAKREEIIELILRFYAYTENFDKYNNSCKVYQFLDDYMKQKNIYFSWIEGKKLNEEKLKLKNKFLLMLSFVRKNVKNWFKKRWRKIITSRTYFEAISVWTWLALSEKKEIELNVIKLNEVLNNENFLRVVSSDWANTLSKFRGRILYIKNALVDWIISNNEWI